MKVRPHYTGSLQPGCPQLQPISVVSPASSQYWLQYLLPAAGEQVQLG
jgi:hypothetical protein